MAVAALNSITDIEELTGTQRAAVLVMYLDAKVARVLINQLTNVEIQDIARAMAEVDNIEANVIEQVVGEFVRDMSKVAVVPQTGKNYALDVLPNLVDDEGRRESLITNLRRELSTDFPEYIAGRPARNVATILQDEHPQVQAVGLLLMGLENAAKVMARMDDDERYTISMRMARIQNISIELADDVERTLRQTLESEGAERWNIAGLDNAAQILGRLTRPVQEPLLERIADQDRELSDILRRRMFRFEDLTNLDDRGVQTLLKSVDRQALLTALQGADETIRELFLRNMSTRAAQDLREELEIMAPVPRSVSRTAGEQIVQIALKLQEEGVLRLLPGNGDDE